jgi:hypothetical protein
LPSASRAAQWGVPFFQIALTHFNPEQSALLIHCTAGTVIVSGPQAVDFYERFCSHRVAWLKADGKDILSITLALHDK